MTENERNAWRMGVALFLWLAITPIIAFVSWQTGGFHGPFFEKRSTEDLHARVHPVALCDALTNTPLASYKFLLSVMPKRTDRPAAGYVVLLGIPTDSPSTRPLTVNSNEWFDLAGVCEGPGDSLKPVQITTKTIEARQPFTIFLDFQFGRPESVVVRHPKLCWPYQPIP